MMNSDHRTQQRLFFAMLEATEKARFNQCATDLLHSFEPREAPSYVVRLVMQLRRGWGY